MAKFFPLSHIGKNNIQNKNNHYCNKYQRGPFFYSFEIDIFRIEFFNYLVP